MRQETIAITAGKKANQNQGTVNTPIHRTSTILFPTLKDYHDAERGLDYYHVNNSAKAADYSYALTGTPTTYSLQQALSELEGSDHTIVTPSGLSAITTVLLSFVSAGDHILMVDTVYGPTRRFCNKELKRLGVDTTYYDPNIGEGIKELIQTNTRLIFTESPGSLTFEVQDIPAITKIAKEKEIPVIIDNSWATSLYFKPFEHGVDVSIHAGTKYIGGHSDIFLGTIHTSDKYIDKIFRTFKNLGMHTSPDVCYTANRGLKTMPTRVKQHEKSALNIAKWLSKQKQVKTVLHPALKSCPGHKIWKRDFTGSTGLFSIILDKKYSIDALSTMIDEMRLFGIGASWGGYESLIVNFDPSTIRTATKWTETNSCVRLYIGLEHEDDLKQDLEDGLKRLSGF